jgi:hypothetical protein
MFLLRVHPSERWMVGAVGIELLVALKTRNLLIPRNSKMEKNHGNAELRYTPGTRELRRRKATA